LLVVVLALCRSDDTGSWREIVQCKQIHLALGPDASSSMTISFTSSSACYENDIADCSDCSHAATVLIGRSPDKLNRAVIETTPPKQYSAQYQDESWYHSPCIHHITVNGLIPSTKYFYRCIAENSGEDMKDKKPVRFLRQQTSQQQYIDDQSGFFVTSPSPGDFRENKRPVTLAFLADIGRTSAADSNFEHLDAHMSDIDVVMFAGDLAYSHLKHGKWDYFFHVLETYGMTRHRPIMVAAGNHDVDRHPGSGVIFVAYENRFQMPQIRQAISSLDTKMVEEFYDFDIPYPLDYDYGNGYYAFTVGPSRNIVICSYSSVDPGSRQRSWLEKELESVNRTLTPWVTVTMHNPMYNSFSSHHSDPQNIPTKKYLEPLFLKYRVNLVFSGHVHGYQRTHPTANGKVDPRGPVYIIGGNGGCDLTPTFSSKKPEGWVASRDGTHYGYATLSFVNTSHAYWKRVSVLRDDELNNTVDDGMIVLPSKSRDSVYIENQYYMVV